MKAPTYNVNDFQNLSEYCTSIKNMKKHYGTNSFTFEEISTKFNVVSKENFIKHLKPNRIQEFFDSHLKADCLKDYEEVKKMIPVLISEIGNAEYQKEKFKRQTERLSLFETKEDLVNQIDLLKTWQQNKMNESQVLYTLEYFFKQSFQYQSYQTTNHVMYRVLCSLLSVCSFREDDFSNITQKFNFGYWGGNHIESFYAEAIIGRNISAWKSIEKYLNRKPFIIKSRRMYEGATFYDENERIRYRCTGWNDKGKIKFVYEVKEKQKRLSFEAIQPKVTKGKWFLEMSDLTIRCKNFDTSNCMGDYKGNIIADLKPSLGITWEDVENGCLDKDKFLSYLNGNGGRQHAFQEVIDNAKSICNVMNKARGIN